MNFKNQFQLSKTASVEQQDYLEKQLEHLGRVLGKLVADLTQASQTAEPANVFKQSQQTLKTEFDLDIEKLVSKSDSEFLAAIQTNSRFNKPNLEKLAELIFKMSKFAAPSKRKKWLQKSLNLYQYLDSINEIYDGFRIQQINKIKKMLAD